MNVSRFFCDWCGIELPEKAGEVQRWFVKVTERSGAVVEMADLCKECSEDLLTYCRARKAAKGQDRLEL